MSPEEYQAARADVLKQLDHLRELRDTIFARDPLFVGGLPPDLIQRTLTLDREATRLRNPDLTVAFVGGFSAGKSSLVNAFLGRYLLPESPKVTTAVPTFIRAAVDAEDAELHFLGRDEVEALGNLYRAELADLFRLPDLKSAPFSTVVSTVEPLAGDGRGRGLLEQFKVYHAEHLRRLTDARGKVERVSLAAAQKTIQDEAEAMFLDRVVLRVRDCGLPPDVVLVDLPGISVPNPRHREITFRFVREEAHAVVLVLMATRLFDRDEIEILDVVRSGEARVAEKTFWVLNRWDALSARQQQQTVADFEQKMAESGIPRGHLSFRTNALHGLLAQLAIHGTPPTDPALLGHVRDYEDAVPTRYGGSHQTALRESQLPALQQAVLAFVNDRLRATALRAAVDNARANFCDPLPHHLRRAKAAEDACLADGFRNDERAHTRENVETQFDERKKGLERELKQLRDEVSVNRSQAIRAKVQDLVVALREKIDNGQETDAYEIYKEIIGGKELRKYPYHFEIEMRVVDNLNAVLKRNFRRLVREQVGEVFDDLVRRAEVGLEPVREDVGYNAQVMAPFEQVFAEERGNFGNRVDGVVMTLAAQLDELLLYKPKTFLGMLGGNEILAGLEKAAQLGFASLRNSNQAIDPRDFDAKTAKIRETLSGYYIQKVHDYHGQITRDIFPIIINNLHEIEQRLFGLLQSHYRPALEVVMADRTDKEFRGKRAGAEERSRFFRESIEQIEEAAKGLSSIIPTEG